jgi:anti-anti-sigma factor
MGLIEYPSIRAASDSIFISPASWDAEGGVLWFRGEHDISTVSAVTELMCRVIALDDNDLTLDLSEVLFMDASTVGVLARARSFLEERGRSMFLRAPSRCVQRVLQLCRFSELVGPARLESIAVVADIAALRNHREAAGLALLARDSSTSDFNTLMAARDGLDARTEMVSEMVARYRAGEAGSWLAAQ